MNIRNLSKKKEMDQKTRTLVIILSVIAGVALAFLIGGMIHSSVSETMEAKRRIATAIEEGTLLTIPTPEEALERAKRLSKKEVTNASGPYETPYFAYPLRRMDRIEDRPNQRGDKDF